MCIFKAPPTNRSTDMAAILSFPTLLERDEAEFSRSGNSNYIRAFDEAAALWAAPAHSSAQDRPHLLRRLDAFTRQVAHLARYRPDCVGDLVNLAGGCSIELRLMPGALRSAIGIHAAND
jgi:hypothetical protein